MEFEKEYEARIKYRMEAGHSFGEVLDQLQKESPESSARFKLTTTEWKSLAKRLAAQVSASPRRLNCSFSDVLRVYLQHDKLSMAEGMKRATVFFPDLHQRFLQSHNPGRMLAADMGPGSTPGSTNSQPRNFEAAIAELKASGMSTAAALAMAARDYPALHAEFLDRKNRERRHG